MVRVGILTSGGGCQGLNVAIRTIGETPYERPEDDVAIFGTRNGHHGLIEDDYWEMSPRDLSGILTLGGAILDTSRQPFKEIRGPEGSQSGKVGQMKKNYKKLRLDCIIILGSDDTHKTTDLLSGRGLNTITLPRTIDNNLWNTKITFDFSSTIEIASMVIDSIRSATTSHGRVFIMGLVGCKMGWLMLHMGIVGGADAILLPETPCNIDPINRALQQRKRFGKQLSILVMARGVISDKKATLSKKGLKIQQTKMTEPSLSYHLTREVGERTSNEMRATIPSHSQHSDSPCPYGRILAIRLGAAAAQVIRDHHFGCMIALQNRKIVPAPLGEVVGKLKVIPLDCKMVQSARNVGISLGD